MWIGILEKTMKSVLKTVGKSAATGAVTDGLVGVASGENVVKEASCGAVSAAVGAVAKEGFEHFVKSTGSAGLVVGVSASILTRYAFRNVFPDQDPIDTDDFNDDNHYNPSIKKGKSAYSSSAHIGGSVGSAGLTEEVVAEKVEPMNGKIRYRTRYKKVDEKEQS